VKIAIRRMQLDDVDTVFELEKEIFDDPWNKESFTVEVESTDNSYPCILLYNNIIAAYAVIWYYSGEVHIGNFAVHKNYRRRGLGINLLNHILDKFNDHEVAYLEVRKSNIGAINLYKKFGFDALYVRSEYYSDKEDAIVMWKKLKS
jgi:[ribosomal protein S18]-alanine N-acetyltransferase